MENKSIAYIDGMCWHDKCIEMNRRSPNTPNVGASRHESYPDKEIYLNDCTVYNTRACAECAVCSIRWPFSESTAPLFAVIHFFFFFLINGLTCVPDTKYKTINSIHSGCETSLLSFISLFFSAVLSFFFFFYSPKQWNARWFHSKENLSETDTKKNLFILKWHDTSGA